MRLSRRDIAAAALALAAAPSARAQDAGTILNVSYDPTRELYKDVNAAFAASRFAAPLLFTVIPSVGPRRDA